MTALSPTYTYTSRAEVTRLFTATGVESRLEDLVDDDQMFLEFVEESTDFINQYCAMIYEESDLSTSRWVRSRCTWYCCFILSQRSGNPALFSDRISRIQEELEKVQKQQIVIPRLPLRANMVPAMSNVIVDDRFQIAKIRVHQSISPGGSTGRQDLSSFPVNDWF